MNLNRKKRMKELVTRTVAGIAYLIVMVGCLLSCQYAYLALMLFVLVMMMIEFNRMNMGKLYPVAQVLSVISGVTIFTLVFCHVAFGMPGRFMLLSLIPVMATSVSLLFLKDRSELTKALSLLAGIVYLAIPVASYNFLMFNNGEYSGVVMLCLFIIVWMSDVGAYCFGCGLGQKYGPRLCPTISPKKSWVGAVGGAAVAIATGALLSWLGYLPYGIWHSMGLALVIDVTGIFGDLIESIWKRNAGIKDSGKIIPGHGGMLDRFDSAVIAIPAAIAYLVIFGLL